MTSRLKLIKSQFLNALIANIGSKWKQLFKILDKADIHSKNINLQTRCV